MRDAALEFLISPQGRGALSLEVFERAADGHVVTGVLRDGEGNWFPVTDGVPVFPSPALQPDLAAFAARYGLLWQGEIPAPGDHRGQAFTNETFSDKWRRFKTYGLEAPHQDFLFGWYLKKFGLPDVTALRRFHGSFGRILEVGPGSGFNTRFMAENTKGTVFALDISDGAHTTFGNTRGLPNCHVVQADLFHAPFPDGSFDFAMADGVLHHTPDTRAAMEAVFRKVRPGGLFFFYVYRRMGAARQSIDQIIREAFTPLSPDECYAACRPITELGRELSRLQAKVTLTEPIEVLGIPAGTHDVQRLFYYGFMKCFWNEAFDLETNNMVNFDWYHPHHAWQHTDEEVRGWLADLGVTDYAINDANPNGISVMLTRPAA